MSENWNFEHTYTNLPEIFYRDQLPTVVPEPSMVIFNKQLAKDMGLCAYKLETLPHIFAGNQLPLGARPIAQAYAGYQFGHFAMLGDGRAVLLGEHVTPDGNRFDIQLKGSGSTIFSRRGDGFAALMPMLREYIISEAMHALGIPTTRSLAVVLTGIGVVREKVLQGAVLTRVAASHIRVGTFNYAAAYGTLEDLRALADYCINRHFPQISVEEPLNKYLLLLRETARLQASLIAQWQAVGFIHGVMNTDNMAISGQTIDYGPCAFMDTYAPDTVFSSIDTSGRYAFGNQPGIAAWNLARLAEALLPLLHDKPEKAAELAQAEIQTYWSLYNDHYHANMCAKLGLTNHEPQDSALITDLLGLMHEHGLDYTSTFRALVQQGSELEVLELAGWVEIWRARLKRQPQGIHQAICAGANPAVIPRNHKVEEALIAADQGDISLVHNLLQALNTPFTDTPGYSSPPSNTSCGYKTFCGT